MMGERQVVHCALFYEVSLERRVPGDHVLSAIDRFADLEGMRAHRAAFYVPIDRPSVDPELMIRMRPEPPKNGQVERDATAHGSSGLKCHVPTADTSREMPATP